VFPKPGSGAAFSVDLFCCPKYGFFKKLILTRVISEWEIIEQLIHLK
jgi:hypothetical protein